jgi:hypothetical protein
MLISNLHYTIYRDLLAVERCTDFLHMVRMTGALAQFVIPIEGAPG